MKISELSRARNFLKNMHPQKYTPEAVKEAIFLKLSVSTLGRKLRQYAQDGLLSRSYYRNNDNEEIAQYAWRIPVPVQELLFKGGKETCP